MLCDIESKEGKTLEAFVFEMQKKKQKFYNRKYTMRSEMEIDTLHFHR